MPAAEKWSIFSTKSYVLNINLYPECQLQANVIFHLSRIILPNGQCTISTDVRYSLTSTKERHFTGTNLLFF